MSVVLTDGIHLSKIVTWVNTWVTSKTLINHVFCTVCCTTSISQQERHRYSNIKPEKKEKKTESGKSVSQQSKFVN